MKRLLGVIAAALVAGGVLAAAGVMGVGGSTSTARAFGPVNGLAAYVVASNKGPLPGCSATDFSTCTARNSVQWYIHVINTNSVVNINSLTPHTRPTLPNAFVVNSIDQSNFVNGGPLGVATFIPPPNGNFLGQAGDWVSTVSCGDPITQPCTTVLSPAVLPGENVAVFVSAWFHTNDPINDPNGTLTSNFVIHGTLNGTPVELKASAPPIQETS